MRKNRPFVTFDFGNNKANIIRDLTVNFVFYCNFIKNDHVVFHQLGKQAFWHWISSRITVVEQSSFLTWLRDRLQNKYLHFFVGFYLNQLLNTHFTNILVLVILFRSFTKIKFIQSWKCKWSTGRFVLIRKGNFYSGAHKRSDT